MCQVTMNETLIYDEQLCAEFEVAMNNANQTTCYLLSTPLCKLFNGVTSNNPETWEQLQLVRFTVNVRQRQNISTRISHLIQPSTSCVHPNYRYEKQSLYGEHGMYRTFNLLL